MWHYRKNIHIFINLSKSESNNLTALEQYNLQQFNRILCQITNNSFFLILFYLIFLSS